MNPRKPLILSEVPLVGIDVTLADVIYINQGNKLHKFLKKNMTSDLMLIDKSSVVAIVCCRATAIQMVEEKLPNLQFIQLLSMGFDGVPIKKYKDRGVLVANAGAVYAQSIAESVLYLLLRYFKKMHNNPNNCSPDLFRRYRMEELGGKKTLVMSAGNIGRMIATRLSGFGVELYAYDPFCPDNNLFTNIIRDKDLLLRELSNYDIVISTTPLMETTKGFCDERFFTSMKDGSLFINVGRDGTVDREAFYDALKTKRIGAIIEEVKLIPYKCFSKYRGMNNVLLSPGIVTSSVESKDRLCNLIVDNLKAVILGARPHFIVNK